MNLSQRACIRVGAALPAAISFRTDLLIPSLSMPERGPFNGQLRRQDPALLFYLDTHWQEDVPRYQELEIIEARWSRSAVVRKAFYRKSDSAEETVAKRGCIVLASPEMALAVDAFSSLRAGELTRQTTLNG